MNVFLQIDEQRFEVNTARAQSLAKTLDFKSPKTDFGAPPPHRQPVRIGQFVGDTRVGGGCNVDQLSIIPHCHGTHTESIGHIVNQDMTIAEVDLPTWMMAGLLTVSLQVAERTDEHYRPAFVAGDWLITAAELAAAQLRLAASFDPAITNCFWSQPVKALIVRCYPFSDSPSSAAPNLPPYYSNDAICWCNDQGICHLLVESPSIDRLEDDGLLTNHHLYWNVPAGSHDLAKDSWTEKTITESIEIDPHTPDGIYLLNLQVPALGSDASPSKPVILPLTGENHGSAEVVS